MTAGPSPTGAPRQRCPNCTETLRARDRFCPSCGARLERPDLRAAREAYDVHAQPTAAMAAVPPPALPPAPAFVMAPSPGPRHTGPLAVAAGAAVLALAGIVATVMLVVTSGDGGSRPEIVTMPQTVTVQEAPR